jgi:hypothetical protein
LVLAGETTGAVVAVAVGFFVPGFGVLVGTAGTGVSVGATVAVLVATGTVVLVAVAATTGVLVAGRGVLVAGTGVLVAGIGVLVAVLIAVGTGVFTTTTGMLGAGTETEAETWVAATGLVVVSVATFTNVAWPLLNPTVKEQPAEDATGIPAATVHVTVWPRVEQVAPPVVVPHSGIDVIGKPWRTRLSLMVKDALAVTPEFTAPIV